MATAPNIADAEVQAFMLAHPEVVFAEYGANNRVRLTVIVDGGEFEAGGHTLKFAHFTAMAKVGRARHEKAMAKACEGSRLPGNGGFIYRHSTGEYWEVRA